MRCQAIKKDGGRCMGRPQKGTVVCYIHRQEGTQVAGMLRSGTLGWHNPDEKESSFNKQPYISLEQDDYEEGNKSADYPAVASRAPNVQPNPASLNPIGQQRPVSQPVVSERPPPATAGDTGTTPHKPAHQLATVVLPLDYKLPENAVLSVQWEPPTPSTVSRGKGPDVAHQTDRRDAQPLPANTSQDYGRSPQPTGLRLPSLNQHHSVPAISTNAVQQAQASAQASPSSSDAAIHQTISNLANNLEGMAISLRDLEGQLAARAQAES